MMCQCRGTAAATAELAELVLRRAFPALSALLLTAIVASVAWGQSDPPVTPGFPNVAQTPGALLSGLNAPGQGRTAILAYHNGILYTVPEIPSSEPGSDYQVRSWDLADPTQPAMTGTYGITPMPINAHGFFKSGDYLVLGSNWPPEAPWSFRANGTHINTRTEFPNHMGAGIRGQLFQPWYVGDTYWSYGETDRLARIEKNGQLLAEWDHLGLTGVIGHPFLIGDLLIFASDQSRTGVATYDVSDPTNPVLLDVLTAGGPGGYWPEIWGSGDGRLYVVFPYRSGGNGLRVVDATDPTDLRFIADTPLPGDASMYVQFQDEFAFTGSHKVDMRTFQSVLNLDGANVTRTSDGGTGVDTSQFLLPLGNLLVTGGIGPNQGMAIWAHQAAPDTRPPYVGYHIPQTGRLNYPVGGAISLLIHETLETTTIINGDTFIVRPLGGDPIDGRLIFAFDDILTFTPDQDLQENTTYEVVLAAGGIKDAAGNGIEAFSFTFSTGSSVGGNGAPSIDDVSTSAYPVPPGDPVTVTVGASDPEDDALEYRFDFGDGSPQTTWSATAQASHTYATRGHYQVSVQARDTSNALAGGTSVVTVVNAPTGTAPTRSSPVVCDDGTRTVWTVNPDNDSVAALQADSLVRLLEQPVCDDPRSLARSAADEIWVACRGDDRLMILDGGGTPIDQIDLDYGSAPVGLAFDPGGTTAYVSLQGAGELRRFDAASRQQTGSVALGPTPRALAVSSSGATVFVSRFLSPRNHAEVWEVDTSTMTVVAPRRLRKFGDDANRDTTASGKGVANYLTGLALSPDGQELWIASNKPNTERGLLFGGEDLDQDNSVRNIVQRLDRGTGERTAAVDLDNSDSASAVAFSPLGDYLLIALQGNDELLVLDALEIDGASGLGSMVSRLGTGGAPQGLCVDATTGRTFVKNLTGRTLTVLETDALFSDGDISVASQDVSTVTAEAFEPIVLHGKRIFYDAGDERMSAEGYISCATCHLDGGHDGRVWDFTGRGEGLRNTTTLRGRGGTDQGNVHWSANFDEIQDFENDIRGAFGGRGFMDEGDFQATSATLGAPKAGLSSDLDALAAYVSSLGLESLPRSPDRTADGALTAEAVAGRAVFHGLQCASCHAGAGFTDSTLGGETLHDVGTLRTTSGSRLGSTLNGIDTPTLLGAWNTAPYFHDGSAPTLDDVFARAGGVVLQAEGATLVGGAQLVDQWVDLNNDDTVHGRAYVSVAGIGQSATFTGVDGGAGGTGDLEIRYSLGWASPLTVRVNGVDHFLNPPVTDNLPLWRATNWEVARVPGVQLNAGATNTIELRDGWVLIDDLTITTADDRAAAQPHLQVGALDPPDRAALTAYVRQLDGRPEGDGGLQLQLDDADLGWSAVPGALGYDVLMGDLSTLRTTGDLGAAVMACLANDVATTALSHGAAPASGEGDWFLWRPVMSTGPGSYDSGGATQAGPRDDAIAAGPDCP